MQPPQQPPRRRLAAAAPAARPALKAGLARRPRAVRPRARGPRPAARRRAESARRVAAAAEHARTGFVPLAVGRTAGAVAGIADSGLVHRITRGRLWIGLLAALLVGIVALNVLALSLNASSSKVARQTDGLKRENSALQAQIAGELSNERVQASATKLGLIVPEPGSIRYLGHRPATPPRSRPSRLANGAYTIGSVAPPAAPVVPADVPDDRSSRDPCRARGDRAGRHGPATARPPTDGRSGRHHRLPQRPAAS